MNIDITTSATVRPDILERTFSSFRENLLNDNHEYRLVINIDPIGELDKTPDDVLAVARKHFSNVIHRIPESPCFTDAVMWCWGQAESDLIFHLEDDWEMVRAIDLDQLLATISELPKYDSFLLCRRKMKGSNDSTNRVQTVSRLSLNPNFIRKRFVHKAITLMSVSKNPEKQLRKVDPECGPFIKSTHHVRYTEQGSGIIVRDIGREWIEKMRYAKNTGFLQWKTKN